MTKKRKQFIENWLLSDNNMTTQADLLANKLFCPYISEGVDNRTKDTKCEHDDICSITCPLNWETYTNTAWFEALQDKRGTK